MKLVCDTDGVITSGEHFYSVDGKIMKSFGSNDRPSISLLREHFEEIIFCSADSTSVGSDINQVRAGEMGVKYVFSPADKRQALIDENMPCVYIGDGIAEPKALINICLQDSCPQIKEQADVILPTVAGKNVFPHLLNWVKKDNVLKFAARIRDSISEKIVLTGVGKNFSLAQLVSEFFLPYNIVAVPLDANHSTHGSLGLINPEDVVVASSKSGNTEELVNMMEAMHKKFGRKSKTFLITSNENSASSPHFDHTLVVDSLKENSLYNLSPQTTIEQYLRVYFTILNVITGSSSCTRSGYLLNHPGGAIGKTK